MAMPVGVTYKGEHEFTTFFGGLVTLILGTYVGALFLTLFIAIFNDPTYTESV